MIEAAIVAAIGTTLLAAASPRLAEFAVTAQVRSAADDLRAGLRIAQREALARQRPVELVLTDSLPQADAIVARPDGRNWVVRAVRENGGHELVASFHGDGVPRIAFQSQRGGVFTFDAFGRLRAPADAADAAQDVWSVAVADRLAIARPMHVRVTAGGSSTTCDPEAGAGEPFSCR